MTFYLCGVIFRTVFSSAGAKRARKFAEKAGRRMELNSRSRRSMAALWATRRQKEDDDEEADRRESERVRKASYRH